MNRVFRKCILPGLILAAAALPSAAQQTAAAQRPTAYMVADAHLDTQWNWDIQTTISTYVRETLDRNLALLRKFPGYIFNFEGGVKYSWMKEYYPDGFEMLKPYVTSGRWHLAGASWDATDAIVPSPESAIRNILLGQTFYRNEFGTESTDIFLPDCFGFGYTLPTVAAHCGLIGFSSQKLGWRHGAFHPGEKKYPFTVGLWKGVDGSEIMMAHAWDYGRRWDYEDLTESRELLGNIAESPLGVAMRYYGTGDIGGSPTITSVDAVERAVSADGPVKVVGATSDRLFREFQPYASHPELPRYEGELLMDVHGTGCYTSQAAMKLYNRQNELLGEAAEKAAVAADLLGVAEYPSERLTTAWQRFIFHQFHDDLTGTSIPRAYEFSWNDELLSLKQFSSELTTAVGAVASRLDTRVKGTPVVIFNPLGHEVSDIVEIAVPAAMQAARVDVYGPKGNLVGVQRLPYRDGMVRVLASVTVPPCGMAVYDVHVVGSASDKPVDRDASTVENDVYRLSFDPAGNLVSLYDKTASRELVEPGKSVRLALFTDNRSVDWPAWEILKETVDAPPVSVSGNVDMKLVENGPLRKTLRITKQHGDSRFTQYVRLYGDSAVAPRIDFVNEIDWHSPNSLLKAEFPLTVACSEATYDLGLGTIRRGNNTPTAYEVPAQQWADLTDASGDYGVTVMNDCKYGWDKPSDNTLRLTLLHTPSTGDNYSYQSRQDFGRHEFTYSIVGHSGPLDTSAASRGASVLNQRLKPFIVNKHKGTLGKSYSVLSVDNDAFRVMALKKAEADDYYVVRVSDLSGRGGKGNLRFPVRILEAYEADGSEKNISPARFKGGVLPVALKANGLKTYKVKLAKSAPEQLPSYQLPLAFDRRCMSWNRFTADADFSGPYSYAAELVPGRIVADGIPFRVENKALLNGMSCRGDTLRLPDGHKFNRLYLLAAAAREDSAASGNVRIGMKNIRINVPSYTGFIGQWGHEGHTEGYLTPANVAWAGTHRHSREGDCPYEFTYMFMIPVDLGQGCREVVLPDNSDIVVFAATAVAHPSAPAVEAAPLFRTGFLQPVAGARL